MGRSVDLSQIDLAQIAARQLGNVSAESLKVAQKEENEDFLSPEEFLQEQARIANEQRQYWGLKCFKYLWIVTGAVLFAAMFGNSTIQFGNFLKFEFNINENVILALLGGFFLTVVGVFRPVMHFLFPKDGTRIDMQSLTNRAFPEK